MRGLVPLLLLLGSCGVFDPLYRCQRDDQCVRDDGLGGTCVAAACAWPAPDCGSGLRFDDSAGPDRGGACTGPQGMPASPTAARFAAVPLPGGAADAPRLGPLFGHGADVYAAGWDGQPFLVHEGGQAAERLGAPLGSDAVVAATASPALLALATAGRLLLSTDGGGSFSQRDEAGIEALHHDGQLLHLLRAGQVESLAADLSRADLLAAPEGGVIVLVGEADGPRVLALVRGAEDRGVVYLRDGAWRRVFQAGGPLSAAALRPGGWAAAGPGALILDGQAVTPAPAAAPRQLAALGPDLWLRDAGARLLLRRGDDAGGAGGAPLREVAADPDAADYDALWAAAGRDAAPPSLWVISRAALDRTYRSRLWRGPAP